MSTVPRNLPPDVDVIGFIKVYKLVTGIGPDSFLGTTLTALLEQLDEARIGENEAMDARLHDINLFMKYATTHFSMFLEQIGESQDRIEEYMKSNNVDMVYD